MTKKEIGFKNGVPENRTMIWEKHINGRTFVFKKAVEKEGVFLYNCRCPGQNGESSTGFHSSRDLTLEEVEASPQFASFLAASARISPRN